MRGYYINIGCTGTHLKTFDIQKKLFSQTISDQIIEFSDTIRPVCLPFRSQDAIDETDIPGGRFVNTASWGNLVSML
jgi:hypothetical protein